MINKETIKYLFKHRTACRWGTYWEYECGLQKVSKGRTDCLKIKMQMRTVATGMRTTR